MGLEVPWTKDRGNIFKRLCVVYILTYYPREQLFCFHGPFLAKLSCRNPVPLLALQPQSTKDTGTFPPTTILHWPRSMGSSQRLVPTEKDHCDQHKNTLCPQLLLQAECERISTQYCSWNAPSAKGSHLPTYTVTFAGFIPVLCHH